MPEAFQAGYAKTLKSPFTFIYWLDARSLN